MVERGQQARFAREAGAALGIGGEGGRQDLDRDVAPELAVARAIDLSHPAGAERRHNRVRAELLADPGGFAGTAAFYRSGRENGRGIGVVAHRDSSSWQRGRSPSWACSRMRPVFRPRPTLLPHGRRRLETLGILRRWRVFGRLFRDVAETA